MIEGKRVWAPTAVLLSAALLTHLAPAKAAGDDELIVTVGARAWINDWDSWYKTNVFYKTGGIQISEPIDSSTRAVYIPSLSLKYGNFLLSGSYLVRQTYTLSGSLDSITASRSEFDVNLGYYVVPGLALTAGYKQILQDYGGGAFKWRGPTVAILPAALLNANWGVYGVASYGLFKLRVPQADSDATFATSFNASYALAEAGVSYVVGVNQLIKALRLTLGYRAQILATKDYRLHSISTTGSSFTPAPYEHDVTYGPTLGISGSF
jgi:hypothetical protein